MDWVELIVEVNVKDADAAADIAMQSSDGVYIEDYTFLEEQVAEIAHVDLIDEALLEKDRSKAKIHLYLSPEDDILEAVSLLKERLSSGGIEFSLDRQIVKEDDWRNNWKQYFQPTKIGEKLLINPSWFPAPETDRAVLSIDPGLAFGTGKHETTKLCLEALENLVTPQSEVLDIGCGSGILAIAAVLFGAKSAKGVDIDEVAVKTANENAALNGAGDRFSAMVGDLAKDVDGKYDIVVANIVADAIIALSAHVPPLMKDGGAFLVSGIIDDRAEDVRAAVKDRFFIEEELFENGWFCFLMREKDAKSNV